MNPDFEKPVQMVLIKPDFLQLEKSWFLKVIEIIYIF